MLNRIPRRNHMSPVLRELHWLKFMTELFDKFDFDTQDSYNTSPGRSYFHNIIILIIVDDRSRTVRTRASFKSLLMSCLIKFMPIHLLCDHLLMLLSYIV